MPTPTIERVSVPSSFTIPQLELVDIGDDSNHVNVYIEGGDGVGKSTLSKILRHNLLDISYLKTPPEFYGDSWEYGEDLDVDANAAICDNEIMFVRNPGSSLLGSSIRSAILNSDTPIHAKSRANLFLASIMEAQELYVRDWIAKAKTVIQDRSWMSTFACQVAEGGINNADAFLKYIMHEFIPPTHVIYLDIDLDIALSRLGDQDLIEQQPRKYHKAVRNNYNFLLKHLTNELGVKVMSLKSDEHDINSVIEFIGLSSKLEQQQ